MTKNKKANKKIKVLVYADAPTCATGFGSVTRNICESLYKTGRYEIDIFGINYHGDPHTFPYRIFPAGVNQQRDPYGRQKFFGMAPQMDFDILFCLQDTFILEFLPHLINKLKGDGKAFKSVCFSGDTDILTRGGIKNIKNMSVGDMALSYDTETGETVFKPITKIYDVPFDGEMINIKGQSTDLSMTPDHRMYMSRNGVHGWTNVGKMYDRANSVSEYFPNFKAVKNNKKLFTDTFDLYKYIDKDSIVIIKPKNGCTNFRKHLKETFLLSGDKKTSKSKKKISVEYDHHIKGYKIPLNRFVDNEINMENFKNNYNCDVWIKSRKSDRSAIPISLSMGDFIKLSAWYVTEGCCTYYRNNDGDKIYNELSIASNIIEGREINYRQHIKSILDSTGINYREKTNDFLLKGTTLVSMFKEYFGNGAKNKKFPDWFMDLDIKYLRLFFDELLKGDGSRDKKNYTTKSKVLAEQIVLLSFMLGIRAHHHYNSDRDIYTVSFTYSDSQNFLTGVRKDNLSKELHDGRVYCVEVEDTHTVFAGRNNYFSITGQCYFPIDGVPKKDWLTNVNVVDTLVAYTKFGAEESKKVLADIQDMKIIPHGANINDYYPLPAETIDKFRADYFGKHKDKYIVTNVNRNQQRKDIPRTIAAFKEFRKDVPESILYLHMAQRDQGWDLKKVAESYGLNTEDDVIFPENFGPNAGYPKEILNLIYNASDLVVSTSIGEGNGLSWVEAMATKTPVLMPNNTAFTEHITDDKGTLLDSGTDPSLFTVLPNDNEVIRPLVDVNDMVNKMVYLYKNPKDAGQKAENAYSWVKKELNWQGNIARDWVKTFDEAYKDLKSKKQPEVVHTSGKVIEAESL